MGEASGGAAPSGHGEATLLMEDLHDVLSDAEDRLEDLVKCAARAGAVCAEGRLPANGHENSGVGLVHGG